jgi:ankyrin repeat protein
VQIASDCGYRIIEAVRTDQNCSKSLNNALYRNVKKGNRVITERLCNNGADVNHVNGAEGATPLYAASHHGHIAVTSLLIEYKANINQCVEYQPDNIKMTPLAAAATAGNCKMTQHLCHLQAGVNMGDVLPVVIAAQRGHLEVVRILCERSAVRMLLPNLCRHLFKIRKRSSGYFGAI